MKIKNKIIFGMFFLIIVVGMLSFSSAYMRSVPQYVSPGVNIGPGGSLINHDLTREMCNEAGQDFIVQVAPVGCEPVPVRSDLLEEQDVYVFCQLSATKLNPLIKVEAIEYIDFGLNEFPKEVMSVRFHPAKAALGFKNDLNSPIMENIGYVVIGLKRQPNESAMPDYVVGNLTARIRYDIKEAFGVGDADFYLPEMTSDEWEDKYTQYGFWDARGYLKVESISAKKSTISIYTGDERRKLSSVTLSEGELSNQMYLSGLGLCSASFQVKLNDVVAPDTRAKLKINSEIVEVVDNERFLDNKCQILDIDKQGIVQIVKLKCEEDEDAKPFSLAVSPKIKLIIEGKNKTVGVGDYLYQREDNGKHVYVGYIGTRDDSLKEEDLEIFLVSIPQQKTKLNEEELFAISKTVGAYISSSGTYNDITNFVTKSVKVAYGAVREGFGFLTDGTSLTGLKTSEGSEERFGKFLEIKGFASPIDGELPSDLELQIAYQHAIDDYDRVIGSYAGELNLEEDYSLGEQALYEKIKLLLYFNQKRTALGLCDTFKEKYSDSDKNLKDLCDNELKLSNSEINSKKVLINGKKKEITFEGIYEPDFTEYGADILMRYPDGSILPLRLEKNQIIYLDKEKGDYIQLLEVNVDSAYINLNTEKERAIDKIGEATIYSSRKKLDLRETNNFGSEYSFELRKINLDNIAKVSIVSDIDNVGSESDFTFKIGIEKRNIQLSPEKINQKINNLNKNIEDLGNLNENLGKVVEVGKAACFVTGGVLTAKNLLENLKGKGIARQKVMRNSGGWYDICNDEVNNKK